MSTIPSSPEDRKAIRNALEEISKCLSNIDTERVQIREILTALEDKYKIPAKAFRKVSQLYHKQNVVDFETETSEIKEIYKVVSSA
jgi:predicted DNA-binding transcriptional regulator YafY